MKTKNKIIIAIIALVIVAGGIFAGLYFGTDIFKKEEQKQEETSKLANEIEKYLQNSEVLNSDKLKEFNKKILNSSYTNKGTIKMSSTGIDDLEELSKIGISFEGKVNPSSSNIEENLALSYNGMKIDANLVKDGEKIGVQSDLITGDDYIAIENNNLKALCEKLGVEDTSEIPDKIELNNTSSEYIPSEEELTNILNKYLNEISKSVEGLETEKTGSTEKITILEEDVYEIIINILNTAKEDTETQNMIVEYMDKVSEISGEDYSITAEDMKEAIEEAIEEIKDTETESGNKIVVKLTRNSNNMVEKAEITVYADDEETVTMEFISTDKKIEMSISDDSTEMSISLEKEESEDSIEYDFTISVDNSGDMVLINANAKYEDLDSNTVTETTKISMKLDEGYGVESLLLTINNQITFEDVETTKLSSDNAVILNELSTEELQKVILEIYTRLGIY